MRNLAYFTLTLFCFQSAAKELSNSEFFDRQGGFINNVYKTVAQTNGNDENFLFSPVSINQSLCMLLNGASENARSEFLNVLNYQGFSLADINRYNNQLLMSATRQDSINKLFIANGLWISNDPKFKANSNYLDLVKQFYQAEVKSADFNNPIEVGNEIHNWIYDKTNGFLDVTPDVQSDDVIVGVNSVYFKGLWKEEPSTRIDAFFNRNGSTAKCKYLKYEMNVPYFSNDYFRAIKLYYKNENYSLVVILPKPIRREDSEAAIMTAISADSMAKLVNKKESSELLYKLSFDNSPRRPLASYKQYSISNFAPKNGKTDKKFKGIDKFSLAKKEYKDHLGSVRMTDDYKMDNVDAYYDVDTIAAHLEWDKMKFETRRFDEIRVPHFETKTFIDFKYVLKQMGLTSVFNERANSLDKIANGLYVSNYKQVARIKVDEKGTEAAAVSYSSCIFGSADYRKYYKFIADHPFLYAIVDERSGAVLFMGRLVDLK